MKTILLVDHQNLLLRSLFSHAQLSFAGKPTGGIYGYLQALCSMICDFHPSDIIVCTDTPPYFREMDYPKYKGDRKKREMDPDIGMAIKHSNKETQRMLLEVFGLSVLSVPGFEADDLIGILLKKHSPRVDRIVAFSGDTDLNQLLGEPKLTLIRGKGKTYNYNDFKEEFPDLEPDMWTEITAMAGSHNGVPGISGIGPVTATKILTGKVDRKKKIMPEHEELIRKNMVLATIPYPKARRKLVIPKARKQGMPSPEAKRFLITQYGIRITGTMHTALGVFNDDRGLML